MNRKSDASSICLPITSEAARSLAFPPSPPMLQPWHIACPTANKVQYLKKKVYFEVQHGLCTGSLLEGKQVKVLLLFASWPIESC